MANSWRDIPWGAFNNISDHSVANSASRRRRSTQRDMQSLITSYSDANATKNKSTYFGVVIQTRQTKIKRSTDRVAKMSPVTSDTEFKNYVYKVYWPKGYFS